MDGGFLRVNTRNSYLEHNTIVRDFRDKLSIVEYRHKYDRMNFCEYDIRGLVSLPDHFGKTKKANADNIIMIMHGVLLTIICGKKLGLIENSFVVTPEFLFVRRGSCRPKLMYLPMDTDCRLSDGYLELVSYIGKICDVKDTLASNLAAALMGIGFNLSEAALVVVEAANKRVVSDVYLKTPKKTKTDSWIAPKERTSAENDESIELLETTCLYFEEEPCLYLLDGDSRTRIDVTSGHFVMGRMPGKVDYCFAGEKYKGISRIHAVIKNNGEDYFLEDLGSSGGTFLNGRRVQKEPEKLHRGDEIRLYVTRLVFE